MPGKLKVRIIGARNLPVMDRASDLTDAFVEVRFESEVYKTEVCRKSLKPQWNSEWFKFEVEDEALQDEPLELRVLDYDTYSSHDTIGKVYIDLNPLLTKNDPSFISGWFPIYDTMHGIRGELNLIVKVELFNDFNKFRHSSCGVQFFCTSEVPSSHHLVNLLGFVEELVVNDDPEYQWLEKIRTSRASNEARQRLFSKLSGELKRKIGLKVLEMGGNSVLGYNECFDLEGESGIVVRGIGTAVTITKVAAVQLSPLGTSPIKDSPVPEDSVAPFPPPPHVPASTFPIRVTHTPVNRRSSESDLGSPGMGANMAGSSGSNSALTTPAPTASAASTTATPGAKLTSTTAGLQQPSIELMEFPFFTMMSYPPGFIVHLGGVVAARSVKLLDKIHNPEEPETRDVWWSEIRTEVRSHAKSMGCHAVLGYTEQTTICEEMIVLSASGTAARINMAYEVSPVAPSQSSAPPPERHPPDKERDKDRKLFVDIALANQVAQSRLRPSDTTEDGSVQYWCHPCHIPYKSSNLPFSVSLSACAVCRKKEVPDVLFTTINPPPEIQTLGRGSLIQARISRTKNKTKGEASAKEISDSLPFLEYELHSQLMNKLRIRGLNGLFGLKVQIVVGENMVLALGTATGVYMAPLPCPPALKLTGQAATEDESRYLADVQKRILDLTHLHKERLGLDSVEGQPSPRSVPTDESEDELSDLELSSGNKDTFVLEIDDPRDDMLMAILNDPPPPPGFEMYNTAMPSGVSVGSIKDMQLFTQVWKGKMSIQSSGKNEFTEVFKTIIRRMCYKMRKMAPCCLTNLDFHLDIPDEDVIQVAVTGCCLLLQDWPGPPTTTSLLELPPHGAPRLSPRMCSGPNLAGPAIQEEEDMMFAMEEEVADSSSPQNKTVAGAKPEVRLRPSSRVGSLQTLQPHVRRCGVELCPMPAIPGGRIEQYLGNYSFFFIRESTSMKEDGGVGGFLQSFVAEVLAIVRGHVASLGGNALVAYRLTHCVLFDSPHKNQCQCLIDVCGDAVLVVYDSSNASTLQDTSTSSNAS